MIPALPAYKDRAWDSPRTDIDPKKKDSQYCIDWSKYIYSLFCRNKTSWGIDTYTKFQELRDYSNGQQDVDKYKTWLLSGDDSSASSTTTVDTFDTLPLTKVAKREGWFNVMWSNISPAPRIMSSLHGQFDKLDFDLYVDCADPDSRALEEEKAYRALVEAQNADWQNKIKRELGIPIDSTAVLPRSLEELDMLKARGGFKLNVARAMQKLVRYSFKISKWDTVVRKKIIDDLICLGYSAGRDYFDTEDNKFKTKWIDPARTVIQFSNEHDYCDSEYAGYFSFWTISNLKKKLPNIDENEWKALAHGALGAYGNPKGDWESRYSVLDPSTYICGYDGFKVPVFEAEWIDVDVKKKLYYNSKYGRKSIIELGYDSKVKELNQDLQDAGASQEIKNLSLRLVRQCNWVIGKDWCFDWGVVKMASREGYSKPQLTFHVEQLLQPSIIERLIPILDQIEITFLRYQNSLAKMVENGYAINTSMLGNVTLGGNKLKPAEVIKLFKQSGIFLYQYSAGTGLYTGGAALPITAIDGGMKNRVAETIQTLEMWMKEIENMTGINPLMLGGTPDPNAPADSIQAALQASSNITKTILDACFEIKESMGSSMMRRMQAGIRNVSEIRKAYTGVISPNDIDALKLMEAEGVQYGLTPRARPDGGVKMRYEKWLSDAMQNVREQRPGADLPDVMHLWRQLDTGGDVDELIDQLRYVIEKNKQEAQAQAEKMIEKQGQVNAQNEQTKVQGALATIKAQAEADMAEEKLRGVVKDQLMTKEKNYQWLSDMRQAADEEDKILNTGKI